MILFRGVTMSERFKEIVDNFKSYNGNTNFTQKDMLMYLVAKVDKIEEKLVPRWVFISCITGIVTFLAWLTRYVMNK